MAISSDDFFLFVDDLAKCGDTMGVGRYRGMILLQNLCKAGFKVTREPKDRVEPPAAPVAETPAEVPGVRDDNPEHLFETHTG